jgi:nicotinate phosphoribosyltransferase
MLDKAGLSEVAIVLSNELDEINVWQIIAQISEDSPKQGADADSIIKKLIFGVGTRLITSSGDSALGGVYKLISIKKDDRWQQAIKISESAEKMTNPGDKQVWRIYDENKMATADMICLSDERPDRTDTLNLHHSTATSKFRNISSKDISSMEPLIKDIVKDGKIIYNFPSIENLRDTRKEDLAHLDSGVKRLINPHYYHVSLSQKLWDMKQKLADELRKN